MAIVSNLYYGYLDMSNPDLGDLAGGRVKVVNHHKIKVRDDYDFAWLKGDFNFNKHGEVTGGKISSVEFAFGLGSERNRGLFTVRT